MADHQCGHRAVRGSADVRPTSRALPATAPNGGYYTEPQLAYFTNVNDQRKIYGASFGVAAKVTDAITSRLDWFYSHEDDVTIDYTDKAWFNGQGDHACHGRRT